MTNEQREVLASTIFEQGLEEIERDYARRWAENAHFILFGQAMMDVLEARSDDHQDIQKLLIELSRVMNIQAKGYTMREDPAEIKERAYKLGRDIAERGFAFTRIIDAVKKNPLTQSEWDRFCLSLKMAEG